MPTIDIRNICKTFSLGDTRVEALRDVSLSIEPGEFVAIMGSSGSGKSTLMNILGCLDQPTSGDYSLEGVPVSQMSATQLADIRNRRLGFVFQGFNLLSRTSALENVELPLLYDRSDLNLETHREAISALERVGLADRLHHEPSQLSGGQQQRVAIARALVNKPALILADEPTGNLDSRTTIEVMALFQQLNQQGITLVVVTHETEVAAYCRRTIELLDGRILSDRTIDRPRQAANDQNKTAADERGGL